MNYFALAKLNLKRNKRRSIRIGLVLVIGLFFSIISLYFTFGFYYGVVSYMDNDERFNSFNYTYTVNEELEDNAYYLPLNNKEEIDKYDGISYSVTYRNLYLSSLSKDTVDRYPDRINRVASVKYDNKEEYIYETGSINVVDKIDIDYVNHLAEKYFNRTFLESGREPQSKGEIIVSKEFLFYSGISFDEAIGKKITVSAYNALANCYYDDNSKIENIRYNIISNMTIVGIYNSLKDIDGIVRDYQPFGGFVITLEDSVFIPESRVVITEPSNTRGRKIENYYFSEGFLDNNEMDGKVTILINPNYIYETIYFKNYKFSHIAYDKTYENTDFNYVGNYFKINNSYANYITFHKTITTITIFVSIISVLIFIISIVISFEIIGYSIIKKKHNIGMMKAIGLKDKGAFKLYLCEFSIMMIYSTFVAFVSSILLSVFVTAITNDKLNFDAIGYKINAHVNIGYYFLATGIVVFVYYLIIYAYLLVMTKKFVNNNSISLLKEGNKI